MNRWFILAVLLLLNERPQSAAAAQQQVLAKPAAVQSSLTDAESEAVDIAVLAELEKQEVVGAAVGILYEGEIVYVRGYGLADRKRRTPVTTATVFNWASNSKPLAAFAAMQLVEEGKLDLDSDVRRYMCRSFRTMDTRSRCGICSVIKAAFRITETVASC